MSKLIENIESKILYYHNEINSMGRLLLEEAEMDEPLEYDEKRFREYWTHEYHQRLYQLYCIYFELLGLQDLLIEFKTEFKDKIKDEAYTLDYNCIPLEYGDSVEEFNFFIDIKKYEVGFNLFEKNDDFKNRKLIEILDSTNEILKITKTEVKKEEDINAIMRDILDLFYNTMPFSVGSFKHKFNHYKPDINIDELSTSIEYKLIRKNEDIGTKIDELIIDANRYVNNPFNKNFIAVFCLSNNVTKTDKQIKEDWNKLNFPRNWQLIIIKNIKIIL